MTENNSFYYEEFLSFLKFLKINNSFFNKYKNNILEMILNNSMLTDTWEYYFFLIDFNYEEYIRFINKTDVNNKDFINNVLCYNIFFFTLVHSIAGKILAFNNVENVNEWLKKQIFTDCFLFIDSVFENELSLYLNGKINSINELIKHNIDIIKILYEEIIPPRFRKILGEFYTPDWLINLILNNLDFENQKFIDPACGSASFLKRILDILLSKCEIFRKPDIGQHILDRIIGFDINIFTVQIARLNLLLSLRNNLNGMHHPVVMPVYFADSLFYPFAEDSSSLVLHGIPHSKNDTSVNFSRINLKRELDLTGINNSEPSYLIYENLNNNLAYNSSTIEKEFLIGNYLAYKIEKRDIALGNPPWLAWDGINSGYRNILSSQWKFLFTQQGWRAKITAGRVDLSAMFVYSSAMYFVKERDSKLIYVLPLSLFKSKSAGEGFRKFRSSKGIFSPTTIWDFSHLAIFSGATNQPIVTFFEMGKELTLPIKWSVFIPKNTKKIPKNMNVDNFIEYTEKNDLLGFPISKADSCSPWVNVTEDQSHIIQKMEGKSFYRARGGINTGGANTIFWIKVLQQEDNYYIIQNIGTSIRAKSQIIQAKVEKQLIYKLIRGRDVEQWQYKTDLNLILPYDPKVDTKVSIPEEQLKQHYPLAHKFLNSFYQQLIQRKEFNRWNRKGSFYELYRIGPYTFSPYKVIWQHTGINKRMKACVLSINEEKIIIDQKIIFVPFYDEDEAHYFCAVINSDIVFNFLSSYLMLDASTHILEHLAIPKFNQKNPIHVELTNISKLCHQLAKNANLTNSYRERLNMLVNNVFSLDI